MSTVFFNGIGGGGSGFQLFTQSNNDPGIYADAAARDVYFGANPADLAELDANPNLIIKLLDNGAGEVAYQQRQLGVWVDVTSLVQGEQGVPGATGNSYFFASLTDRDDFFNTPGNEGLLENGLPVQVNQDTTATVYYWAGATSPVSYDPELFRPASVGSSAGSLFLGNDGMSISSAGRNVNLIDAYGQTSLPIGQVFTGAGSAPPNSYVFGVNTLVPIADVFDTQLSDPETMQFTTDPDNVYITGFRVRPATTGMLRVQAFAGTLETDPVILDSTFDIVGGDIGTTKAVTLANGILSLIGDDFLVKFSGVDLFGGVQTSGDFIGQTVPYTDGNLAIVTLQTVGVTETTLTLNNMLAGAGGNEFYSLDNMTTAANGATILMDSPAGLNSGFILRDDTSTPQLIFAYSDSSSSGSMDSEVPFVWATRNGNKLRILQTDGSDATPVMSIEQQETNTGSADIFVTDRTPVGNILGVGIDLALRDDGVNSAIYINKGATSNDTSWEELATHPVGSDAVHTTDVLTANFLVKGNGTTNIAAATIDDVAGIYVDATDDVVTIRAAADQPVGYTLKNSTNGFVAEFLYDDLNDEVDIITAATSTAFAVTGILVMSVSGATTFNWSGTTSMNMMGGDPLTFGGTFADDTNPLSVHDNTSGTNGVSVRRLQGDRSPRNAISGSEGDTYHRKSGEDSTSYVFAGTTGNANWIDQNAGSVLFFGASSVGTTRTQRFLQPEAMYTQAQTNLIQMVIPRDGFLRNLHVFQGTPGVGFDLTYTIWLNTTSITVLTVTMAASDSDGSASVGLVPVSKGDKMSVHVTKSNVLTTSPNQVQATVELV